MTALSKRAQELVNLFGTTKNMSRLTRELKDIQKAQRMIKLANSNITKILKGKVGRKKKL